jgi:hypothetical protein
MLSDSVRNLEVVLSCREYPENCGRICAPSQFGPNNSPNPRTYPVNLIYYSFRKHQYVSCILSITLQAGWDMPPPRDECASIRLRDLRHASTQNPHLAIRHLLSHKGASPASVSNITYCTTAMTPYTYADLDEKEIRLLTLLPSRNFDDPIRITIAHVPFAVAAAWESHPKQPPLKAIRKTLPKDLEIGDTWRWNAYETLEGRILYSYWDDERDYYVTTWTHPTLDESEVPHNDSDPGDLTAFEPTYEALSYTWGSAINPETAYVERQETTDDQIVSQTTMELGQNLATALRHLRYLDKPRILWVDAICIDQQNNSERDQQVQRMGGIYKYADRVVVWLGLSSEKSSLALSTLEDLGKQVEATRDRHILPSPDCAELQLVKTVELPFDEGVWQVILDILERP